jgi:hypothetical protein
MKLLPAYCFGSALIGHEAQKLVLLSGIYAQMRPVTEGLAHRRPNQFNFALRRAGVRPITQAFHCNYDAVFHRAPFLSSGLSTGLKSQAK